MASPSWARAVRSVKHPTLTTLKNKMSFAPLSANGQLARNAVYTPYYGLVQLALATIAYTDPKVWQEIFLVKKMTAFVAALPQLPQAPGASASGTLPGTWQIEWGPTFDLSYSNVMYGVTYREPVQSGYSQGAPVFAAVVIRGTDINAGGIGFIQQLQQDLGGQTTVTMTMPNPSSDPTLSIANGTNGGLNKILRDQPNKLFGEAGTGHITDWVQSIYQADNQTPLVVTGHSLGGCLTTVMATYLYYYLKGVAGQAVGTVVPNPFAAPTAGLTDFAGNFNSLFPKATLWWNSFDVVPNAFQQQSANPVIPLYLQNIANFWTPNPPGTPNQCEMDMLNHVINNYPTTYTHPSVGAQVMQGFVWAPPTASCKNDWITQLEIQHFPPMYHRLISQQTAVSVATFPLPVITSNPNPCTAVPSAS